MTADTRTTILGIDPGLNTTGYGILDVSKAKPRLVEAGVVRGGSNRSLEARLKEIYNGVREVLDLHRPQAMAIEELYSHYARPRTSILMGHARGVVVLAASLCDVPVVHYSATQIKKLLTGSGHAPKTQMQSAVCRELNLAQPPEPPDVADAIAIALCHAYLSRNGRLGG